MKLSWGDGAAGAGDSALNLAVTNLNLADWKAFLGSNAPMGVVNLTVKLLSQQSGKQLNFDLASRVDDLAVNIGSNQLKQAAVTLDVRGQAADLKRFNLSDYRLQLTHQGQWLILVSGSGRYDTEAQDANLQTTVEAMLPRLLQALGRADANASSGMLTLKSRIIQKQQTQTVSGNLAVADFTGRYGDYKFDRYNLNTDLDIEKNNTLLKIRKAAGTIRQGQNPGGAFDVAGNLDTSNQTTQLTIKLDDLNQNALGPFLAAALGDKKLVSISITANTAVNYSPEGDSSVKGDLQVAKLLVEDPKQQLPATPLEAKAIFDASIRKQVLDLRQFQINLTPTARAKNEVQIKGRVDLSNTNAIQGALKLVAESLDVTPYYDLFADKPKPEVSASTPPAPTPAPSPKTEPPAVKLPFQNFTMDVDIGRFFLREVDIAKLQTGVKLDGGHVVLKPFQLALNGAPVSANVDLNLGVPGYQYDITFKADKIPLEPLANTFVPDKRGMYKGQLIANAQIKGAGTTGVNLRKALTGQLGFYISA